MSNVCHWIPANSSKICGQSFENSKALVDHLAYVHVRTVVGVKKSKCRWNGCGQNSNSKKKVFTHLTDEHNLRRSDTPLLRTPPAPSSSPSPPAILGLPRQHLSPVPPTVRGPSIESDQVLRSSPYTLPSPSHPSSSTTPSFSTSSQQSSVDDPASTSNSRQVPLCRWRSCPGRDCPVDNFAINIVGLEQHLRDYHLNPRDPRIWIKCLWEANCTSRFKEEDQLIDHVFDKHLDIPRYGCPACRQVFKRRPLLKNHHCRTVESSKLASLFPFPDHPPSRPTKRTPSLKVAQIEHLIMGVQATPLPTSLQPTPTPVPTPRGFYSNRNKGQAR
ncbi:uncharacterized protein JCM6883_005939 [Sporobolomyces salmoneus]|uniref:uncharacterized protein n=1 Tax=Sporobolomyces salmoneus TaxID=183962 RepID=UPI003176EB30